MSLSEQENAVKRGPAAADETLRAQLQDAHEQLAATSEVLRIIASSPGQLEPVFTAMLENATRICGAKFGIMYRYDAGTFQPTATCGVPPEVGDFLAKRGTFRAPAGSPLGELLRTKQPLNIPDIVTEQTVSVPNAANTGGARSFISIPMLKEGDLVGAINIYRTEVRPFTDKQIELVKNFAAQAVIAIENTRLLNELRARTDDLTESLEQQTATSEVLKVISSSPGDLEPVFRAMLENAVRICDAKFGTLFRCDDQFLYRAASVGTPIALAKYQERRGPFRPAEPGNLTERVWRTKEVAHSADYAAEPNPGPPAKFGGARSTVAVPMLKDAELIGIITIYRQEIRPFTERQIELVKNFAAQAVIAIENTRLLNELRARTDDLTESLEQQTATSEVLSVISSSPGELEPVFNALLENATRLCGSEIGSLFLREHDSFRHVATHGPKDLVEARRQNPLLPITKTSGTALNRMFATKGAVQIADIREEPAYRTSDPQRLKFLNLSQVRSILTVPMLKEGEVVGAIAIHRREVQSFTEKQIKLVQNFAAQAVIAIENTRLLNELRARTDDLTESLEQQTATSEVLKVISSSPGELEPVFRAMLENAVRICEAKFGMLYRNDGELISRVASTGVPPELAAAFDARGSSFKLEIAGGILRDVMRTKKVVSTVDERESPNAGPSVKYGGARSMVGVPMLKDSELVGAILIYRQEVRPFTDKQIELVTNFAAQAVIAIENTRLLNELRARTDDLTESLEQQTATSEVLKVISSSPGDLAPVFQAMLENATRICEANFGMLFRSDGDAVQLAAGVGLTPELAEYQRQRGVFQPKPDTALARALQTKQVSHIPDAAEGAAGAAVVLAGAQSVIAVPMLKNDVLIGAMVIYRQEKRPFTDKQIELLQNFAAQAVIAIENTRLLNELRQRTDDLTESLEQQTATSEVLGVISSSPSNLQPVFETILQNGTRLCDAKFGLLFSCEGRRFRLEAGYNTPSALTEHLCQLGSFSPPVGTPLDRLVKIGGVVRSADELIEETPSASSRLGGARSLICVPMSKDSELVGAIAIYRQEVRPFTDKQIELLQNFAAQAVIAIENTRLLNELRARTDELERSYGTVRQQASQLEHQAEELRVQSDELRTLNQQLEGRVAEQVGEIERMGRLRRFLPPQVADLIVSTGAEKQLESHRREIAALYCDLRGFTGFSESSDPEDVMTLLREYHEAIGKILFKYGGTLERFAGDGVMVIFNDPVPVPNPAMQAVLMALEMRGALGALVERWSSLGHDLGFGIGISHGYATLGTIGFEGRFDYAAIGTVSNVASRLCDEAKSGQILVSPRVLLAVKSEITAEPVGDLTLKGIRRPMLVHNVVGAVGAGAPSV